MAGSAHWFRSWLLHPLLQNILSIFCYPSTPANPIFFRQPNRPGISGLGIGPFLKGRVKLPLTLALGFLFWQPKLNTVHPQLLQSNQVKQCSYTVAKLVTYDVLSTTYQLWGLPAIMARVMAAFSAATAATLASQPADTVFTCISVAGGSGVCPLPLDDEERLGLGTSHD